MSKKAKTYWLRVYPNGKPARFPISGGDLKGSIFMMCERKKDAVGYMKDREGRPCKWNVRKIKIVSVKK